MFWFGTFASLVVGALCFAWWRGGAPERIVATLYATAWTMTVVVDPRDAVRWWSVETWFLAIDLTVLLVLIAVALKADRYWTMLAASLQLLMVLAHAAKALNPDLFRFVYMVMSVSWSIVQLLVLIGGTALVSRRRHRGEVVRSWSS